MSAVTTSEAQIRALIEAVDRADRSGDRREADRLMARARDAAPDHPGVLNAAGMRSLMGGDAGAARPLLERAAALDPASSSLWLNLALVHRELRDDKAERAAIDRALAADPRHFPSLLHKARLLERQGKSKQAAYLYHGFLCCVPPSAQQLPAIQSAIGHAQKVVDDNNRALEAFLEGELADARARHAGAKLERFQACYESLVGRRPAYAPQPTFMLFPRLPAIEFLDREDFPWLDAFEAATEEIRSEALRAFSEAADDFVPYIAKPSGAPIDQWRELNGSKRWSTYFLLRNGTRVEEHLARCPKTAELLSAAPLCDVPGHAPTAFFSVLAPRTRIPAHTGVTNTRFIVHLPLVVPPACGFRVGAERRDFREGRAWVFDDTFEHEAWNDSDEPRIILILDVWNSFLTGAERDLVATVTHAVQEYHEGESPFQQGG
jgi:aspartyl/asparaginyl beta-hydroxylase (cupin superfamily)